jgi:hypothetical protein
MWKPAGAAGSAAAPAQTSALRSATALGSEPAQ